MKRMICLLFSMILTFGSFTSVLASAEDSDNIKNNENETPVIETIGVIRNYSLSIYKSGSQLYINAKTTAYNTVKTIGFTDIIVEYSTDASNWSNFNTKFNFTVADSNSCSMVDYQIPITNGYYYRVRLNHYAKEYGLFGNSQTEPNVSNVVS